MTEEVVNPDGVFIAGSFQGWEMGTSQLFDDDGDGIYIHTAIVDANIEIQWKYSNGPAWDYVESVPPACGDPMDNNNRSFEVTDADTVLDVVCFGSCQACEILAITTEVTLTVFTDNITVAEDGMFVAGTLNNWSGEAMIDNGDGSWSVTKLLEATNYEFKFQNGLNVWEELDCGGNRSFSFEENDPAFSVTGCFGQCSETCPIDPDPAEITFSVDASQISIVTSGVYLMGSFTTPAWQEGAILMSDSDGDGIYTVTTNVSGAAEIQFKFNNGDPFPNGETDYSGEETADFINLGCGVDNGFGGSNRTHIRSGVAETLTTTCFNSCVECAEIMPALVITVDFCDNFPSEVRMTGPWWGWDTNAGPVATNNGDGSWSVTFDPAPTEEMHYLWIADGVQEDLVAAAIASDDWSCAPITDYISYANRQWEVGSGNVTNIYGTCVACAELVLGCMYLNATNYNELANDDDGSCIFLEDCVGDFDGDEIAATSDLLLLLSGFGTLCD